MFPQAGVYRLFVQTQTDGVVITSAHWVAAEPPADGDAPVPEPPHSHH